MGEVGAMQEDRYYRIAQVGRELEWSSGPASCSKLGHHKIQTRLLRALSGQVLKTWKVGESTTFLCKSFS